MTSACDCDIVLTSLATYSMRMSSPVIMIFWLYDFCEVLCSEERAVEPPALIVELFCEEPAIICFLDEV